MLYIAICWVDWLFVLPPADRRSAALDCKSKNKSSEWLPSDQSAPLLALGSLAAQVRRLHLAVASRRVVGLVSRRGRRVLHDDQADRRLAGRRRRRSVVGSVLLGGVFPPAVVQDAGNEEDKQQDDITGHQDDEVQGHRVNLQVEFHKTHGAASYLASDQLEDVCVSKRSSGRQLLHRERANDEMRMRRGSAGFLL